MSLFGVDLRTAHATVLRSRGGLMHANQITLHKVTGTTYRRVKKDTCMINVEHCVRVLLSSRQYQNSNTRARLNIA